MPQHDKSKHIPVVGEENAMIENQREQGVYGNKRNPWNFLLDSVKQTVENWDDQKHHVDNREKKQCGQHLIGFVELHVPRCVDGNRSQKREHVNDTPPAKISDSHGHQVEDDHVSEQQIRLVCRERQKKRTAKATYQSDDGDRKGVMSGCQGYRQCRDGDGQRERDRLAGEMIDMEREKHADI